MSLTHGGRGRGGRDKERDREREDAFGKPKKQRANTWRCRELRGKKKKDMEWDRAVKNKRKKTKYLFEILKHLPFFFFFFFGFFLSFF